MLYQHILSRKSRDTDTLVTENRPLYGKFLKLLVLNTPGFVTSPSKNHSAWAAAASPGRGHNRTGSAGKSKGQTPLAAPEEGRPPQPCAPSPAGGHRLHLPRSDLCSTLAPAQRKRKRRCKETGPKPRTPRRERGSASPCPAQPRPPAAGLGGPQGGKNRGRGREKGRADISPCHPLPPPLRLSPPLVHFPATPQAPRKGGREVSRPPRPGTGQFHPPAPSPRPPPTSLPSPTASGTRP